MSSQPQLLIMIIIQLGVADAAPKVFLGFVVSLTRNEMWQSVAALFFVNVNSINYFYPLPATYLPYLGHPA